MPIRRRRLLKSLRRLPVRISFLGVLAQLQQNANSLCRRLPWSWTWLDADARNSMPRLQYTQAGRAVAGGHAKRRQRSSGAIAGPERAAPAVHPGQSRAYVACQRVTRRDSLCSSAPS
jgi:hypothetical protein